MNHLFIIRKYLWQCKVGVLSLAVAIFFLSLTQMGQPILIGRFVDCLGTDTNGTVLIKTSVMYLSLLILGIFLNMIVTYISQKIGWTATNQLKWDIISHSMDLDVDFHKKNVNNEIVETVTGDVENLFNYLSSMLVKLFLGCLMLIGIIIISFTKSFTFGIVQVLFSVTTLLTLNSMKKNGVSFRKENRKYESGFIGLCGEIIESTEDINGTGTKMFAKEKVDKHLEKWKPVKVKDEVARWKIFIVMLLLQIIGYGVCFIAGTSLWQRGVFTIGTIYLFYNYTKMLLNSIETIQQEIQDLQRVGASIQRLDALFDEKTEPKNGGLLYDLAEASCISFKDVSFSYEDKDGYVLQNLSFDIKRNKKLALIGPSGGGKTTIASLLVRFYDLLEGSIQIDGTDIKSINTPYYRDQIVYLTQNVTLFNASLRDNVTFFNKDIPDSEIIEALGAVGLESWILSQPSGLDTIIGIEGIGLSAGEKQLISCIRALIKKPEIIILDEVTAKIDPITEEMLNKALDGLMKNRFSIIISHKAQTVLSSDECVLIENGKISEYGKTEVLVNDDSSKLKRILHSNSFIGGFDEEISINSECC